MAKVTITPISSTISNTAANTINNNLNALADAIENTLSRDGTIPNQMDADIDLNNNDLINVNLVDAQNLLIDGQDVQTFIDQAIQAAEDAEEAAQEAIDTVAEVSGQLSLKEDKDQKGIANGYAPVGPDGKIPSSFIPEGGSYLGIWDADTNTPTITAGVGSNGDFYSVAVAGTQSISGSPVDYFVGDQVRFNGGTSTWERIPDNASVIDVAGKTGNVVLVKGDVGLGNVDNTSDTAKPVSTAQQTAIDARVLRKDSAVGADASAQSGYFTSSVLGTSSNTTGSTNFPTTAGVTWSFEWVNAQRAFDLHKSNGLENWYLRGHTDSSTPNSWKRILLSTDIGSTIAPLTNGVVPSEYLNTRFVTPEEKGAVGDGVTDDTTAMGLWWTDVTNGKIGVLGGPSKNYKISSGVLTATDKTVVILGAGSTITQTVQSRHISITNTFTEINNLSGTSSLNHSFDGGATTTPVTRVNFSTPANLANYAVGDMVKVVSDSLVPDEEIGAVKPHREGEFAQVGAIDGTGLILTHKLRFTVSGNPRVAKMNITNRVLIENLRLDQTGFDESTPWDLGRVSINNVYQPTVNNLQIVKCAAQGLQFASCFQPATTNLAVSNARTNATVSAFGYGLYETSCAFGVHVNPRFVNCRHGFTTVMIGTTAGDNDISRRGRNQYTTIINGTAHGCTSAAWDTHADSFHTSFIGCTASGVREGPGGERLNFQLRGQGDSIDKGVSYGSARGYLINQISPANPGQTDYCRITNSIHIGTSADSNDEPAFHVRSTGNQVIHALIENCRFERNGSTAPFVKASAGVVRVINSESLGPNSTSGNFFDFVQEQNSKIIIRDGRSDNTGSHASASYRPFRSDEAGTIWDVDGWEIEADSGKLAFIVSAVDASGGREVEGWIRNVKTNVTPGAVTSVGTQLTNSLWVDVNGGVDVAYNNNVFTDTYSTNNADETISLGRRGGQRVFLNVTVTGTTVEVTAINDGAFAGQLLTIRSATASTQSLQITAGGTIAIGSNITLAAGAATTLCWTGSSWMRT